MYNRYIRNDRGTYTRIPEEERRSSPERADGFPPPDHAVPSPERPPHRVETDRKASHPPPKNSDNILQDLLEQFHLDRMDSGDLLLLGLLFLLLHEDADEELLVALGLLLIL